MSVVTARVGDLCMLVSSGRMTRLQSLQHPSARRPQHYMLFDVRPELFDGVWLATGPSKRLGFVIANKDMFVLLENNEANDCNYPKILTTDGLVGYLYLHNDNETVERVKDL